MLVLATLMIPDQMRLVPVYRDPRRLPGLPLEPDRDLPGIHPHPSGLRDQPLPDAPVLPDDPEGLEEAAKLDDAGYFKTYWRVMLPLASPALAAVVILELPGDVERLLLGKLILLPRTTRSSRSNVGIAQFTTAGGSATTGRR